MTGFLGIAALALRILSGASVPDEVSSLAAGADGLLQAGHPRKALVLLRRARALDPGQVEIDRLLDRCRGSLGLWVSPEAAAGWIATDDRIRQAAREKPDSMAAVARSLVQAEDLGEAVRIWESLSSSHAATQAFLDGYRDARARQEMKVAFHLDLSRRAATRGLLSDALLQARMAWSARPEDPLLREKARQAQDALDASIASLDAELRGRISSRDVVGALETVRRIRLAAPVHNGYRRLQDSLLEARRVSVLARIREIDAMAESGREKEAMQAMVDLGEVDPQEPLLAAALETLQRRIQERRRRRAVDSLAWTVGEAIRSGDAARARSVYDDLQRLARGDSAESRLRPRIDSLRAFQRSDESFQDAMTSARRALARKDLANGKAGLQKALASRPNHPIARRLLTELEAPRPAVAAAPEPPPPLDDQSARRVRELLLSGVVAYRAGEYDTALARWRQALQIDPGCVQAQRYIDNVGKKQERLR